MDTDSDHPQSGSPAVNGRQNLHTTGTSDISDDLGDKSRDLSSAMDVDDNQMADDKAGIYRDPTFHTSSSFGNLFCLLALISEQGSGGLVDKIIIAQHSLGSFINKIRPGAYKSLTKVDFKSLDAGFLQPIGVYGSRDSIVSFLLDLGIVDTMQADILLLADKNENSERCLQPGLYIAFPSEPIGEELYVIFWPEIETWCDDAPSPLRRNRITFMRYLTQIAHQILCLFSKEESRAFVWNLDADSTEVTNDIEDENVDRLFTFEVAKTLEQKEDLTTRPGFTCVIPESVLGSASTSPATRKVADREPRIFSGESSQGFLTVHYVDSKKEESRYNHRPLNRVQLVDLLNARITLDPLISFDALFILLEYELLGFPDFCKQFTANKMAIDTELTAFAADERTRAEKALSTESESEKPEDILRFELLRQMMDLFPFLNFDCFNEEVGRVQGGHDPSNSFSMLVALFPALQQDFNEAVRNLKRITSQEYKKLKTKLLASSILLSVESDLSHDRKADMIPLIFETSHSFRWSDVLKYFSRSNVANYEQQARKKSSELDEVQFLQSLSNAEQYGGDLVTGYISNTLDLTLSYLIEAFPRQCTLLQHKFQAIQEKALNKSIEVLVASKRESLYIEWRAGFLSGLREIQSEEAAGTPVRRMINLIDLSVDRRHRYASVSTSPSFYIRGQEEIYSEPYLEYKIHLFGLTADHQQQLQLNPRFVPQPHIEARFSSVFSLPLSHKILHCQALSNDRLLLITDDQAGTMSIFLQTCVNIGNAIRRNHICKVIRQEKTGKDVAIAFDENKRMIALHACAKSQLYIFVFDETFVSLQSWAHPVDLTPWYEDGSTVFQICFVTGSEELLLVNNQGQARMFSLIAQQFRPASLKFQQLPLRVYSSPDGTCFFAEFEKEFEKTIRAYHWTTFGSSDGIPVDVDSSMLGSDITFTSFVNRASIHLLMYDFVAAKCVSVALDITKKATEFMFQQKNAQIASQSHTLTTVNNCLLDCFHDVWTRFPVLPAVKRQIKTAKADQPPKRIVLATYGTPSAVGYFDTMIKNFEQKTRKPVGDELRSIVVQPLPYELLRPHLIEQADHLVSKFHMGEWIVDILCLIPIHLAITRENRFVPLKDGVISTEYERSILGAEVSMVADSISFGWYESILQSYMAMKPVKVVSSMGEQSVGKSYALNHFADTSFAGSAMRTTEGVWMSVTPTSDFLLVTLDFEGVHSIERSAQEDTLLVLFNTAISNLVLFRNNFALSRDIAGLFQSFQSSSSVFDPAANPTLFRSMLLIIIKDVVDSDKMEIVREFSLKFHKIVQEEQESNFITRLHRGHLSIVPWPVIESKQFYTLFPTIKSQLDRQPTTHGNAGIFLQTMKTLMAKLKANDWRALSQSMAGHRAHRLLTILQNALAFGYSEIEPHPEALKDFDTDMEIEVSDTDSRFFVSSSETVPGEVNAHLSELCKSWEGFDSRLNRAEAEWIQDLSTYLTHLIDVRVNHVGAWITKNLENFPQTSHANITALNRMFEATTINVRANTGLCKQQCSSCHLSCLLNRRHDGGHTCLTSHTCPHLCEFEEGHLEAGVICGYSAGHGGKHICVVDAHLCGEPCILRGKPGCLNDCTQVVGHREDGHRCSSRIHACGRPCTLSQIPIMRSNRSRVSGCEGLCMISSEISHGEHICDNRMCPMKCELCNRLCASDDHLHSLHPDAVHLCGESHSCSALCSIDGICDIDTAPQSIEATFTGRHETFQYTKYSQVAKRLPCAIPIPAMQRSHVGKHCHDLDPKPFHFCETQCAYCGYYCTLPRGHPQQEHETSHGSMSKTRWAIEDPDVVVELNGRKFGSDDDGAPMMCNLFCQDMGRHVHIDYCRAQTAGTCNGPGIQHITTRLSPQPDRPKDWITHELYWKRSGFKDPYSKDDRTTFGKCDVMCPGSEHAGTASNVAQPSYCTLPLFHAPCSGNDASNKALGYTSRDGHHFSCKNPIVLQQAFHVIFVIDRSGSMALNDRKPLPGTPVTGQIAAHHNDRLGAVYSALYSFWVSRSAAVAGRHGQQAQPRRDAYSVLLFDDNLVNCIVNDFTSSPDQLLAIVLPHRSRGGTDYSLAVRNAERVMQQSWSTERSPVVIFLSDGECGLLDQDMQTLCRSAIALGKPLSFHAVSFGPNNTTLRRMAQIAHQIQTSAPRDPLTPQGAFVESSFAEALDSVRLAETFLGIAESLKKPRGTLFTSS